jgi:hypothetical protein
MRGALLGRADGPQPLGIEARQQPGGWSGEVPGGASLGQQTGGKPGRAIRAAFPLLDTEPQELTCALRARQPHDCTNAPAGGLRGHQEDAVPRRLRLGAQALACLDAQALGAL